MVSEFHPVNNKHIYTFFSIEGSDTLLGADQHQAELLQRDFRRGETFRKHETKVSVEDHGG